VEQHGPTLPRIMATAGLPRHVAGQRMLAAAPRRARSPALDVWRKELAAGLRTATTFDPLWRAACWEAAAKEADSSQQLDLAGRLRREARDIILAVVARRVP